MRSAVIAALAVLACVVAAPASAAEPTPGATLEYTLTCPSQGGFHIMFSASGLTPDTPYGAVLENAEGSAVLSYGGGTFGNVNGTVSGGFGTNVPNGTYTVYVYTGPYQTVGEPVGDDVFITSFRPELTTAWVSAQVEINCGPSSPEECKADGWTSGGYRNQGQCVSRFAPGRV